MEYHGEHKGEPKRWISCLASYCEIRLHGADPNKISII